MIGQLSSGIAHEIRNPLNFLSLSIAHIKERILEERMKDRDDLLRLLDDLIREIHRVNELIHNFLFLGKPIRLNREWVATEARVGEVLQAVRDKVRAGIEVKVRCLEDGRGIYCDREYMRLCLVNLLINAVQSIPDGGIITIQCGVEGSSSFVSVTDTGEGIDGQEIEKIFEPYYSTKKIGIGLGLTITKRFVEEHGGVITMESEKGKGTTITLKVPHEA